ncbi:MAG: hypothetical protein K0S70_1538 [Microbacterium sp.]|nr:hypothetical protein [Microbacterium sp.]
MTTVGRAGFIPVALDVELAEALHAPFETAPRAGEGGIDTERRRRREWHVARRAGAEPAGRRAMIRGVPVRRYAAAEPAAAILVWLHGGAWIYGEPEGDERMLQTFAARAGVDIVAVDYRLAPEHPYPAAIQDAAGVVRALMNDGASVIVAGASAGATLAAGVCLLLRDEGGAVPAAQLLITPPLDDLSRDDDSGPLNRADMDRFWETYLGGAEADAYAAPARARTLRGLPPACIFTTSSDPLRLEGWRYASRLVADGVEVRAHFLPGGYHGFEYEAPETVFSRAAVEEFVAAIRAFAKGAGVR